MKFVLIKLCVKSEDLRHCGMMKNFHQIKFRVHQVPASRTIEKSKAETCIDTVKAYWFII